MNYIVAGVFFLLAFLPILASIRCFLRGYRVYPKVWAFDEWSHASLWLAPALMLMFLGHVIAWGFDRWVIAMLAMLVASVLLARRLTQHAEVLEEGSPNR